MYLSLQQHGGPSVTWPNSAYWWLWTAAIQLCGGAQNSRQLFALIVQCDSALLNGADTLLINGKRCIYILASGTIQLLRWQGARCWLHSVTNRMVLLVWLLQIRLRNDWLIYLLIKLRGGGVGARDKRQKAQSFYAEFSLKIQAKKTKQKKTKNQNWELGRIWKQLTNVRSNISTAAMWTKGFTYVCVSVCLCVCVSVWQSQWAPGLGSVHLLFST